MKRHPILTYMVALACLIVIAVVLLLVMNARHLDPVPPHHTSIDPNPPGSIGWFTEHGNPICGFAYSYPDPDHPGVRLYVINLIPYFGKHPSRRWHPLSHEMPRPQAEKLCHDQGAVLWHGHP